MTLAGRPRQRGVEDGERAVPPIGTTLPPTRLRCRPHCRACRAADDPPELAKSQARARVQSRLMVACRQPQRFSGLLDRQTAEEPHGHEVGEARRHDCEPRQRTVQVEQLDVPRPDLRHVIGQRHPAPRSAALGGRPASRVIDQDLANESGPNRVELGAVLPTNALQIDQPQIGFMDERRRRQRVVRRSARNRRWATRFRRRLPPRSGARLRFHRPAPRRPGAPPRHRRPALLPSGGRIYPVASGMSRFFHGIRFRGQAMAPHSGTLRRRS